MKFTSFARLFGERGQRHASSRDRRPKARRSAKPARSLTPAVEHLEDRTLMSVLPPPVISDHLNVALSGGNHSSPSVAVDPVNPQKVVAVYTRNDPSDPTIGLTPVIVEGVASVDGGKTWQPFLAPSLGTYPPILKDPTSGNLNISPPIPLQEFPQSTDPTVAFDRSGNFYILLTQHSVNNANGVLLLHKYDFSATVPVATFTNSVLHAWVGQDPVLNPTLAVDSSVRSFVDPVSGAVQTNTLVDPATGQGMVYVAWNTNNTAPGGVVVPGPNNFNPNAIKIIASADGGQTFTTQRYVNDGTPGTTHPLDPNYGPERNATPQLVVSQGSADGLIQGGQLTVLWNNNGARLDSNGNPVPGPYLVSEQVLPGPPDPTTGRGSNGGVGAVFVGPQNGTSVYPFFPGLGTLTTGGFVSQAADGGHTATGAEIQPDRPAITTFTQLVNITDPNFVRLSDLDVALFLEQVPITGDFTPLQTLRIVLIPPVTTGVGPITLLDARATPDDFSAVDPVFGQTLGVSNGTGLGIVNQQNLGTIFDQQAPRSITEVGLAPNIPGPVNPRVGLFRPEPPPSPVAAPLTNLNVGQLNGLNGLTPAQLNGIWTLRITDTNDETESNNATDSAGGLPIGANDGFLSKWELRFTSGLEGMTTVTLPSGLDNPQSDTEVATTTIAGAASGVFPLRPTVSPDRGIGPSAVIAADNTLGSASPHQGRLYVAYVDNTGGPADNTDIHLVTSDDGGLTWIAQALRINDDNPTTDGFSQGDRPQFLPAIAVDQYTGTLVVTWYDARFDPARARVARFIATSIDGGQTFGPQTFLNRPDSPIDAVTRQSTVLGPVPDNQSTGNATRDQLLGFGSHEGLAVAAGRVYALWSGNENTGPTGILTATATIAAGPRVISSDMGPVTQARTTPDGTLTYNNTFAADGTRQLDGFLVTFDRRVDPLTFTPADVHIIYRDASTSGNTSGTDLSAAVISVTALDNDGVFGATQFLIRLLPQSGVGTYSYLVGPNIRDSVRSLVTRPDPTGGTLTTYPAPANQTGLPIPPSGSGGSGDPLQDVTRSTISISGVPNAELITDLNVNVTITHSFTADLRLTLIAPNGARVELANNRGNGANFTGTTFDDQVLTPIAAGLSPFTGSFRPETPLSAVDGLNVNGDWVLEIEDAQAGDVGVLVGWSLRIQTGILGVFGPGNLMDQNSNGQTGEDPSLAPFTGTSPGDFYAVPRPNPPRPVTFSGISLPPPFDLETLPLIIPGPHVQSILVPYIYQPDDSQVNVPIPPVGTGGSGIPAQDVTTSRITITGVPGFQTIADVKVNVSLTHPAAGDLRLSLVAPDGTTVLLANQRGGVASNFTNTTFGDQATTPIGTGAAPFTGFFLPESPLAVLNGKTPNGVWTLLVEDASAGLSGTLVDWSLTIQPTTVIPAPSSVVNLRIPVSNDGGTGSPSKDVTSSTIGVNTFTFSSVITDVNVNVSLSHTRVGDLRLSLIAPDGTRVALANNRGGTGADYTNTTFDDQAAVGIGAGLAPFTGTFRPETPLSSLNGLNPNGNWTLSIEDTVTGQIGTLLGWSLSFQTSTTDQLILNNSVSAVDVVFDRDMDPASFDADGRDLLRMIGPAGQVSPTRVFASTIVQQIPDGGFFPRPLDSFVEVRDDFTVADVNLRLNITHPLVSDLTASLIAPDGTTVLLFQNVGGLGQDFSQTLFDDAAATPIAAGTAPFAQDFQPATALSALNGLSAKGIWTLRIMDDAGTNAGTLNSWSLTITPRITVTPNPPGTPAALAKRTFRINFPTQVLSGTYTMVLSPAIQSASGALLDTNLNAGLDLLRDTPAPGSTATTVRYDSTAVPVAIPVLKTIQSALIVPDRFVLQGIVLTLNIQFPEDPDLTARLIAPDGTIIQLFTNVGSSGSNRANFSNTVFDDLATTPIQNGGAPFFGRFNPQFPLSDLIGRQANGTWLLEIVNNGNSNSSGTLLSWSLILSKAAPAPGLGEPVADQPLVDFRIFAMDPATPQAHNTWTPVGPASSNQFDPLTQTVTPRGTSGQIGAIAVDPSDPSGNTVFIGGGSGGVWKTTNFLTTDPDGPTYVPLTDFAPPFGLNIGGIAVFDRNGDPNQSIVVAGTGFGDGLPPSLGLPVNPGIGFLLSRDGGASWTLFDSDVNVDAAGNPLPFDQRSHTFLGTSTFKVVMDPRLTPQGEVIIYAALTGDNPNLAGNQGGIWRSIDSGRTWTQLLVGDATDVVLDPNSGVFDAISNPTSNLNIVYAALRGTGANGGVFLSPNRGQSWSQMLGGIGNPLIQNGDRFPTTPIPVGGARTPNAGTGRIVLAKPALTGRPVDDVIYQGWLYALVVTANNPAGTGSLDGLYVTKDFGENWTQIQIPTLPPGANGVKLAVPSNDTRLGDYDPFASVSVVGQQLSQGNYDVSLAIDPTDANVLYIGGTQVGNNPSGLLRVDTKGLSDPHALFVGHNRVDGGQLVAGSTDPIQLSGVTGNDIDPTVTPFLNVIHDPNNPFLANSTILVSNTAQFANTGSGAKWIPFDQALQPDPFDPRFAASTNVHRMVFYKDPLTGHGRLIFGSDGGVFTAVDRGDGTLIGSIGGVADLNTSQGDVKVVSGSRNGNLQLSQFFQGAVQPSLLAAQVAALQGMFYGNALSSGFPQSDANILDNGNITWTGPLGQGSGIATDQTGSGTLYQYKDQCCPPAQPTGTNFLQVDNIGRTFGLLQQSGAGLTPDPQWPYADGFNFAVNPLNGDQIIISSGAGRIFGTTNQGRFWLVIGDPASLDGSNAPALAFGAPDPNAPGGSDVLNNFLYAGTVNGNIFVTFTGGGATGNQWFNITNGDLAIDRAVSVSPIRAIVTNPTRGSHEAYAITSTAVYHIRESNPNATGNPADMQWRKIFDSTLIANLPTREFFTPFVDPTIPVLGGLVLQPRNLEAMVADWRYAIPDNPNEITDPSLPITATHPVLYIAGEGGVYRSVNNGASWTLFPHRASSPLDPAPDDGALVDGGLLPNAHVTDLDLSLGNINPTTGRPDVSTGPSLLVASTFGRGAFAVRLAPVILPNSIQLAPITNVLQPEIVGFSQQTAFGNMVRISIFDLTDPKNPVIVGGYDPNNPASDNPASWTAENGRFRIAINPGVYKNDGTTDGLKTFGVQASDDAGAIGSMVTLTYQLSTTPFVNTPILLDPATDSGQPNLPATNQDRVTNVLQPIFQGSVQQALISTVFLVDLTNNPNLDDPNAPIIGMGVTDTTGTIGHIDPTSGLFVPGIQVNPGVFLGDGSTDGIKVIGVRATNGQFFNTVRQTTPTIQIILDTTRPGVPTVTLSPFSDSGTSNSDHITLITSPTFQGLGEGGAQIRVFARNTAGTSTFQLNFDAVTPDLVDLIGNYVATSRTPLVDGTYEITVDQIDVTGNVSDLSAPMQPLLVITSQTLQKPTLALDSGSDTATPNDNITAAIPQVYNGTTVAGTILVFQETTNNVTTSIGPFDTNQIGITQQVVVGNLVATFNQITPTNFQVTLNLMDGVHTVLVTAASPEGSTSVSDPLTVSIDRSALDPDRRFIRQIYQNALGRAGSISEWNFWVPLMSQPEGRRLVANSIERSAEARRFLAINWYSMFLGRQPQNGEEQYFVNLMLTGVTEEDALSQMLGSDEYLVRAPGVSLVPAGLTPNGAFVAAMYSQLLNRAAAANEIAFWEGVVPVFGRQGVARAILGSVEYRARQVTLYYFDVLRRPTPPREATLTEPAEIDFWVFSNLDLLTIRIGFESSDEFYSRVGGFRI